MSHGRLPVDLFNPGHVFASLGVMEVALALHGEVHAAFNWRDPSQAWFLLESPGPEEPVAAVFNFLRQATVSSLAPCGSELTTADREVPTRVLAPGEPWPVPVPRTRATLPAVLSVEGLSIHIRVDHWADGRTRHDDMKLWGGSGGYPGAGLLRDALDSVRSSREIQDPFNVPAPQSSSFRLDWRRDYVPLDAGFSLNKHSDIVSQGYPWVEILGAIGLSHARPQRPSRKDKLLYRYGVLSCLPQSSTALFPPALLRLALGAGPLGALPRRTFTMRLGWPGQENQARSITSVSEDPAP